MTSFYDIQGQEIDLFASPRMRNHFLDFKSCASIIVEGTYQDKIYDFLRDKKFSTVFDLGANVGLFSLHISPICEKIFALEPTPSHYEVLEETVGALGIDNIECLNCAVGIQDGYDKFLIHDRNSTMNSFINCENDPHGESILVETKTLSTLIDNSGSDNIDFVKMDIEGFERILLYDSSFLNVIDRISYLYVELHEDHKNPNFINETIDFLKSKGKTVECLGRFDILVY